MKITLHLENRLEEDESNEEKYLHLFLRSSRASHRRKETARATFKPVFNGVVLFWVSNSFGLSVFEAAKEILH